MRVFVQPSQEFIMQGKQRRGRRPIVTTLVSERRIPGGRERCSAGKACAHQQPDECRQGYAARRGRREAGRRQAEKLTSW